MQTFFDHLNSLCRDYTRSSGAFLCRTPFGRSRLRRPISGRCTDPADPAAGQGAAERGDDAHREHVRAGPAAGACSGQGLRGVAEPSPVQAGAAAVEEARRHSPAGGAAVPDDRSSVSSLDVDRPRPAALQPRREHRAQRVWLDAPAGSASHPHQGDGEPAPLQGEADAAGRRNGVRFVGPLPAEVRGAGDAALSQAGLCGLRGAGTRAVHAGRPSHGEDVRADRQGQARRPSSPRCRSRQTC